MKRRKLQEKCREWGLSEQGSDQQLKARHQEFVNLYNAECDSFFPRSEAELVRIIHEREKAIRVSFDHLFGLFFRVSFNIAHLILQSITFV